MFLLAAGDFDLTNLFADATSIMGDLVTMATTYINTLWTNPIGKISICAGVIAIAISLGYKLTRLGRRRVA